MLYPGGPSLENVVVFDPSNPGWIYVVSSAGVFSAISLTKDYGATWIAKASPPYQRVNALGVDPDQPNILVAGTSGGMFKSADGGNSWTLQSGSGFSVDSSHPIALVSHKCSPNGGLFAIGFGLGGYEVDFSPDDGATWKVPQVSGSTYLAVGAGCAAYALRTPSTDAFVAKISSKGEVLWATYLGGSDTDAAVAMTADAQGNVYVTGSTLSQDFPATVARIGVGTALRLRHEVFAARANRILSCDRGRELECGLRHRR
jgi:hypothetical protein